MDFSLNTFSAGVTQRRRCSLEVTRSQKKSSEGDYTSALRANPEHPHSIFVHAAVLARINTSKYWFLWFYAPLSFLSTSVIGVGVVFVNATTSPPARPLSRNVNPSDTSCTMMTRRRTMERKRSNKGGRGNKRKRFRGDHNYQRSGPVEARGLNAPLRVQVRPPVQNNVCSSQ